MERYYKPGDEPVPRYVLRRKLGKGAFGEVWKATTKSGVNVALKIISLENKGGLKEFRAIRTVKNIHHPNLVPIVDIWLRDADGNLIDDAGEDDSGIIRDTAAELFIAMGLGEKNLLDRLKECQKQGRSGIPPEELLRYMEDSARAIDYLNFPQSDLERAAIQHCDIKPGNIMMVGGSAQVCDFGLARVLGSDARATRQGDHMSVPYTAPELFWDASKPSQWSDQYSLAVTYVELRTGHLPFEHVTPAGMMFAHTQGKLDLSKLPALEQAVIRRATSVEAVKRFSTTMEMVQDLRRAYDRSSKPSMGGPWMEDSLQKGAEIVPGYRLVRRIGQGGYGTVWEARAPGGRPVALKIICNLEAGTGRQEFKALELIKSLNHLHLLELHAYWLLDAEGGVIPDEVWNQPNAPNANTLVIATKLAQMNLQQRLHECQQTASAGIPADELIGYMRQSALAIDYLNEPQHSQEGQIVSIQHRDIKPENILLVGGGTVQVGDFGLARVLEGTSEVVRRESRAFTPPYAAPELYTDQVTRWTDQYALALTYYKLRTGVLPFSENFGRTEIMMAHVEGKLDLSRLPETEKAVIARATSLRSEARFPTCLAMVDALDRALKADFPLAEAEPLLRPRVDRHLLQTSPYTPDSVPDVPPVGAMARSTASPSTRLGTAPKQGLYFTDPGNDAASITNTPQTIQHPTEPAPAASAAPHARRAWVQPVQRSALSPTKAVLVILLAVVLSAGAFAAYSWYKGRNGGLAAGDTSKALPSTPPVTTPSTESQKVAKPQAAAVIAEIDGKLKEGDSAYAGNGLPAAIKSFQRAWDISKEHSIVSHWNKAIFGLAKTYARQAEAGERPWVELPPLLAELRSAELDPANAVRRDLLLRLAAAHGTSPRPVTEADLELLERLNTHASGEVLDQWEESRRQSMQKQVAETILKQMDLAADDVPKGFDDLEPVFRTGNKLAAIVKTSESDVRQRQSRITDSIWTLAGSGRSKGLPFEAYAKHEEAQRAKRCLEKLQTLTKETGGTLTPEREHELALALWHASDDKDAVRERVARLLESCKPTDGIDNVPHLLVKAKVQPRGYVGSKTAFETYDAIYQNVRKNKKGKVLEWYELLLLPAIEHGRKTLNYQADITNASELALKEQVGKCYLAKATLLGEFPGVIVDNWELERMKAGEEATKLWEDPGLLLTVCDWHMKWAAKSPKRSQPQREYLEKALDDAAKATKSTDPKLQSHALNAKGFIQEELGVLFTERERFAAALADYSASVDRDSSNPRYLVDRGRCWVRQSQFGIPNDKAKQAVALDNAKKDLQLALEKLPGEQQSDAWYWLAMAYRRQEKPDYRNAKDSLVQAFEHLDSKQSSQDFLSDLLMALLNVGEVLYWDSLAADPKGGVKIRDAEKLDLAAQAFHHFGRMAQKSTLSDYSTIKSEVPQFTVPQNVGKDDFVVYANGRLRDLADGYWFDPDKKSMDKVLELTRLGMPDNPLESSHYHVYCLNRRNILYGLHMDKLSEAHRRELDDKLLAEAEHAVKSAGHGLIPVSFLIEAHLAAYQLYLNKKDNAKAREHLQKTLSVPGLTTERRQDVEKLLAKIKE